MERNRNLAGFTLFELLVVLAITGVVSTIGVGAFFKVTSVWRQSAFRMELGDTAESLLDSIKADMDRVASSDRIGQAIKGVDSLNSEVTYNLVQLADDRVVLPLVQKDVNGKTERLAVMYHVQREGNSHVLTRTIGPLGGAMPGGAFQEIAQGVLCLEIEYLSGGAWHDSWTETFNPEAIRVSVTVNGQLSRPDEQISRSRVFPIHVK